MRTLNLAFPAGGLGTRDIVKALKSPVTGHDSTFLLEALSGHVDSSTSVQLKNKWQGIDLRTFHVTCKFTSGSRQQEVTRVAKAVAKGWNHACREHVKVRV
jgi:tRNA(Ile)-lysidine synthase TilS/MesJ